ncbi:MAG TPA: PP2C family protein-serine/threonine phosphatase [Vicinamibacterales bacterium]|jgi:sigma-B regulation protein RsbU (phosphoserine phosphatase)|nr:PP2C family protein-serine/threonine phosphatase [Vicinamibacterales bacterium]
MARRTRPASGPHWFDAWTRDVARDVTAEDLQRLFTRDTRDAYRFFTRGLDEDKLARERWLRRQLLRVRQVFVAFTLKLSPARRALYLIALVIALIGVINLYQGWQSVTIPFGTPFFRIVVVAPQWANGTFSLLISIFLINLLVLLEVADRLSLKGELEVAREIQLAMLPTGTYTAADSEICGLTRPANTVGGDFYDVLPLPDGRVIVTIGDVAGKGSPAALLMALLLAVLRTLVDEQLEAPALVARLNTQICRHSPASRFITLFYGVYTPSSGEMTYVNAGQNPPLLRRSDGSIERLHSTGVALGMFEGSTFAAAHTVVRSGDLLVLYSDGITEAENPAGIPFEETGLERFLSARGGESPAVLAPAILKAVEAHAADSRFTDDLTVLVVKRAAGPQ